MSSSTVSKRLCTALPRQSRALSLYSLQHIDPGPPPQAYARLPPASTARHPASPPAPSHPAPPPLAPSPALGPAPRPAPPPHAPPPHAALFPPGLFPPAPFPAHLAHLLPAARRARRPFRLHAGAYGIPKRRAPPPPPPPPPPALAQELSLAVQVGEDAYFLRADAMGVADGVGGWAKAQPRGADSALFSRSLMHYCSYELALLALPPPRRAPPPPPPAPAPVRRALPAADPAADPIAVLQRAYERSLAAFARAGLTGGSATALLAVLRGEELRIAHLGDCAVCLVRDGGIVYRSEEMQHAFNYPLQLGPASPTRPAHARAISLRVQQDDIVILASDGMTDNLWDEDVLDEVRKFTAGRRAPAPAALSEALCARADAAARRARAEGPFARRAREEGVRCAAGGKCDDISVLVAVVAPQGDPPVPGAL